MTRTAQERSSAEKAVERHHLLRRQRGERAVDGKEREGGAMVRSDLLDLLIGKTLTKPGHPS